MVEWSITAVLKTAVLRGTGGSNPSLSANKGVNQVVTRFTPFFTPKNQGRVKIFEINAIEAKTSLVRFVAFILLSKDFIFSLLKE